MPKQFTIIVNKDTIKVTEDELTGAQIKAKAGAPLADLLEQIVQGNDRVPINDEQVVVIKSGLRFITHPGGKDS